MGVFTVNRNGFDQRFPPGIREYAQFGYNPGADARPGRCWLSSEQSFTDYDDECVDRTPSDAPLVFVWGDSHAGRLYAGIRQIASGHYRVAQFTRDGCPPLLVSGPGRCPNGNAFIVEKIHQTHAAIVVLFAAWQEYSTDWRNESVLGRQLLGSIAALRGVPRIIVIGPSPRWDKNLPRLVFEAAVRDPLHRAPSRTSVGLSPAYSGLDSAFRTLLAGQPVTYFSVRDAMCDGNGCLTRTGDGADTLVTWDYGHFTTAGAAYVAKRLLPMESQ